jgi:peptidoglycan/LPS O-acetylase OafA/YrhL
MAIAWQVVLAVPVMVWAMRRIRPAGVLALTAAVVIAGCYLVPLVGMQYDGEKSLIVGRALEVLGGSFLAFELWPDVRERLGVSRRGAALLVAATVAVLAGMYFTGLGGRWLYRAAGLALVAGVVYARPIQRLRGRRIAALAVAGGGASFAVYILHEPLMLVIRRMTGAPQDISLFWLGVISLVVVLPVAVLFNRGVEAVQTRVGARARADAKGEAA